MKSLTYFEDAEGDVMPVMLIPTTWEQIKMSIVASVEGYLKAGY
jgi:hypothetical protein